MSLVPQAEVSPAEVLANALTRHYNDVGPVPPAEWRTAHRILDVALTVDLDADRVRIERGHYRRNVLAPVETFRQRHPDVLSVADLSAHIAAFPAPGHFAREDLSVDGRRGAVVVALAEFLKGRLDAAVSVPGEATEAERLARVLGPGWTDASDHDDVATMHVGEQGLAYLQMRLGAQVLVPEPVVFAFLADVVHGVGDAQTVAEGIRRAGLAPLAVLQALRADWAQGRAWGLAPPTGGESEAWLSYLRVLNQALGEERVPWDAVLRVHRAAPHRPPGLDDAEKRDALGTLRAFEKPERVTSFATVADHTLRALYLDADGSAFDAEAAYESAHAAAHDLARDLRATGEPLGPGVLSLLHELFDRAGSRTSRHWWRRTWDE